MPAKNGFQLNDRDIELLHYTYELRLATIDQLAASSGRSPRALWGGFLKLKERRYLASVARFMQKHVYTIGSAGLPVMVEHGYAPQEFAERRLRHNELTEIGIRHSLFVADIHSRMLLLTRTGPIKLMQWVEGPSLWDSVVAGDDEPPIPVRPDAYFVLKHTDRPEGEKHISFFPGSRPVDHGTYAHGHEDRRIPCLLRAGSL